MAKKIDTEIVNIKRMSNVRINNYIYSACTFFLNLCSKEVKEGNKTGAPTGEESVCVCVCKRKERLTQGLTVSYLPVVYML